MVKMNQTVDPKEHKILMKYRDTISRIIKSAHPEMDIRDIYAGGSRISIS